MIETEVKKINHLHTENIILFFISLPRIGDTITIKDFEYIVLNVIFKPFYEGSNHYKPFLTIKSEK